MFRRLPSPDPHALPALVAVVLSLAVPYAAAQGPVSASATSEEPGSAQSSLVPAAEEFAVDSPAFASARQVAEAHWGGPACNGAVAISWKQLADGTNATATWRNPTHAWDNPSKNFDCEVEINADADFDFAKLCTVLTHEIGHLAGRQHASAEGELMSPIYTDPTPECVAASPEQPVEEQPFDELDEDAGAVAEPAARAATQKRSTMKKQRRAGKRCVRQLRSSRARARCAKAGKRRAAAARARSARSAH